MKFGVLLAAGLTAGVVTLGAACQLLPTDRSATETPSTAEEAPTTTQVREGLSSPEPTATPTATTAAATPEPEHPYQENFWSDANIAEARSALDRGEDIQVPDEEGMTSLHVGAGGEGVNAGADLRVCPGHTHQLPYSAAARSKLSASSLSRISCSPKSAGQP